MSVFHATPPPSQGGGYLLHTTDVLPGPQPPEPPSKSASKAASAPAPKRLTPAGRRQLLLAVAEQLVKGDRVLDAPAPTAYAAPHSATLPVLQQHFAPGTSPGDFAAFLEGYRAVFSFCPDQGLRLRPAAFLSAAVGDDTPYHVPAALRAAGALPERPLSGADVRALSPAAVLTALCKAEGMEAACRAFPAAYGAALVAAYGALPGARRRQVQGRVARRLEKAMELPEEDEMAMDFEGLCCLRRTLEKAGGLPAIVFVMSRGGCDAMVRYAGGAWSGMHWKGRGSLVMRLHKAKTIACQTRPNGWIGGWRRLPKRLGAVTVGCKCL